MDEPKLNKHRVKASVQILNLTKNGSSVEFEIYDGKKKLGTISLGQGSFEWFGYKRQKSKSFSWPNFVKIMNALFYDGAKVR